MFQLMTCTIFIILVVGGIFQLSLSFTEDYNLKPPEIHFMTIPFHPNGNYSRLRLF